MLSEADQQRFWKWVDKTDECWLCLRAPAGGGYTQMRIGGRGGKMVGCHRIAYELLVGPIPDGMELDHLCMVRNCVNPAHLEPVDRSTQMLRSYASRREPSYGV